MNNLKPLLAALGVVALAGPASAQSSVTLFGIVDIAARAVDNGDTQYRLDPNGLQTSRIGVRAVEDLGRGLKAGFWLEGELIPDTGNPGGQTWQRRATVSLMGDLGEVRLGRDKVPTVYNLEDFDPFRDAGVARSTRLARTSGLVPSGVVYGTASRADNVVSYLTPSGLGGFFGQVSVAAGEGTFGNKYSGGRVGYRAGPVYAAIAYGTTEVSPSLDADVFNLGATYDLKSVKLWGFYSTLEIGSAEQRNIGLGLTMPVGNFELRASYQMMEGKESLSDQEAWLAGVGAVYNLSKRTALYGTYSTISNTHTSFTVASGSPLARGDDSSGVEFGIRHSF